MLIYRQERDTERGELRQLVSDAWDFGIGIFLFPGPLFTVATCYAVLLFCGFLSMFSFSFSNFIFSPFHDLPFPHFCIPLFLSMGPALATLSLFLTLSWLIQLLSNDWLRHCPGEEPGALVIPEEKAVV